MIKDITKYVQECLSCQKKRLNRRLKLEQEIDRLEKIWKEISIDHITKLLKSKEKNSILVIKD